jgi:hypothetical protein
MTETEIDARLGRIEATVGKILDAVGDRRPRKRWYTTGEAGVALDRDPYTVRQWCRSGRVRATKRACGRGTAKEWIIDADELDRIANEGLLPASGRD